ncbi:MAG: PRD domain-containing protein [Lachnospiraceae bacterium]|nr:PRD domain-containing protein [Lachnospiraceae bacterium]
MSGKNFTVVTVINNNVESAVNERRQERILVGRGIGFKMRKGDAVDLSKVDKLDKSLDESIFLNLIDHISFAVSRMEQGLDFKNTLLWEIIHFYPQEYKVAQYGLELIKEYTGYQLPDDEAGSIAIYIVNAEFDSEDRNAAVRMTELIHKIVSVVRYQYHTNFEEESVHFVRFITHLKFFASRLFGDKMLDGEDRDFQELIQQKYPDAYECAGRISRLVWQDYQIAIPEEELVYLTVYIKRITTAEGQERE